MRYIFLDYWCRRHRNARWIFQLESSPAHLKNSPPPTLVAVVTDYYFQFCSFFICLLASSPVFFREQAGRTAKRGQKREAIVRVERLCSCCKSVHAQQEVGGTRRVPVEDGSATQRWCAGRVRVCLAVFRRRPLARPPPTADGNKCTTTLCLAHKHEQDCITAYVEANDPTRGRSLHV